MLDKEPTEGGVLERRLGLKLLYSSGVALRLTIDTALQ